MYWIEIIHEPNQNLIENNGKGLLHDSTRIILYTPIDLYRYRFEGYSVELGQRNVC